jgi:hypothetical protein
MTLGEKQKLFALNIGKLIIWAYGEGFELTFGEAFRTPEQAALNAKSGKGISNSLHTQRLAVDLNLFKAGQFLDKSEDHFPLGNYWKSLHPLNRWGGDFQSRPDGNHYSMAHEGRA